MLAMLLVHIPLAVFAVQSATPSDVRIDVFDQRTTGDCRLEILTPADLESRALAEFDASVDAYMTLQRRLARALMTASMPDDEGTVGADGLRAALLDARPQAREGAFFTPSVAELFTARIDRALLQAIDGTAAPLYQPLPGEDRPLVNGPFPVVPAPVQWPALARALPAVPADLAYAFWGRDLVLVDMAANLVLDILPDALPEGAGPGVVYQ